MSGVEHADVDTGFDAALRGCHGVAQPSGQEPAAVWQYGVLLVVVVAAGLPVWGEGTVVTSVDFGTDWQAGSEGGFGDTVEG